MYAAYACMVISALLYTIPFVYIDLFSYTLFFYAMPILYAARRYTIRFIHGFLWSFLIHIPFIGVIGFCFARSCDQPVWMLCIAGLLVYSAACLAAGFLFECAHRVALRIPGNSIGCYCLWMIVYTLYLFYTTNYFFWVWGENYGCMFYDPLIVLIENDYVRYFIQLIGIAGVRIFLACFPVFCVIGYSYNRKIFCIIFAVVGGVLLFLEKEKYYSAQKINLSGSLSSCIIVPFSYQGLSPVCTAAHIVLLARKIMYQFPHIHYIFMPEGSLNEPLFLTNEKAKNLLIETCPVPLIIGVMRREHDCVFNSIVYIHDGLLESYDKKFCVPLTEHMPPTIRAIGALVSNFVTVPCGDDRISQGTGERPVWKLLSGLWTPYICSEFFYARDTGEKNIIALCSDRWALYPYIRRLMAAAARFIAVQYYVSVLYISYSYGGFITPGGDWKSFLMWR